MVLMPGFQSTRLVTEGALEPFFFLYTDDSIQGNPETCKQSSIMLNYEVKNTQRKEGESFTSIFGGGRVFIGLWGLGEYPVKKRPIWLTSCFLLLLINY